MTPTKAEDRSKIIALIAAIAVVFGFGAWSWWGRGGASPRSSSPEATMAAPTADTASGASAYPAAVATAGQPVVRSNPNNNPFQPVDPKIEPAAPGSPARGTLTPPRQPDPVVIVPTPLSRPIVNRTPRPPLEPLARQSFPGSVGTLPAPVAPPRETPMELVGVVSGTGTSTAVAMIRAGQQQYLVRVGERIDRYKVARISSESVVLRRGSQARVLHIGLPVERSVGREVDREPVAPPDFGAMPVAGGTTRPVAPTWQPVAKPLQARSYPVSSVMPTATSASVASPAPLNEALGGDALTSTTPAPTEPATAPSPDPTAPPIMPVEGMPASNPAELPTDE